MTKIIHFDRRKHRYFLGSRELPSVTTILAHGSERPDDGSIAAAKRWRYEMRNWHMGKRLPAPVPSWDEDRAFNLALRFVQAGERGSVIHAWIERLIRWQKHRRGHTPEPLEHFPGYCLAAVRFIERFKPEAIHIEHILFSREHRYAGTSDLICFVNGNLTIVDWKSSRHLHNRFDAQVAAYARAYREMTGQRSRSAILVHLLPDGTFRARCLYSSRLAAGWREFRRALANFRK